LGPKDGFDNVWDLIWSFAIDGGGHFHYWNHLTI
jgi:hypothetical protein